MKDFYIYFILDTRKEKYEKDGYSFSHEPFYIGKGTGNRYKIKWGRNKQLLNRINEVEKSGNKIKYITLGGYNESEAFEAEKHMISLIGRQNQNTGPLLNLQDGGKGSFSYINQNLPNGMLGKTPWNKGKKWSPEVIEKLRLARLGKSSSMKGKKNPKTSASLNKYYQEKRQHEAA